MPLALPAPGGTFSRDITEQMDIFVIREQVHSASAVAGITLSQKIPANSHVLGVGLNLDSDITLATAVKIGLGILSGDLDLFCISGTTMTKNTKVGPQSPLGTAAFVSATSGGGVTVDLRTASANLGRSVFVTSDTSLVVSALDTNGAAAGTMIGTVGVYVWGIRYKSLPDAP